MRKILGLVLVLAFVGCGENQDTTSPGSKLGVPGNLKALSVNATTVRIQWTAPPGPSDTLSGYVVQVGNVRDTLGKAELSYLADSLTPGEKTFTVYARGNSGGLSDGVVIKWAPAARFDTPQLLYEYKTNVTTVNSALDVGSPTLDPKAMSVTSANASYMDLYLFGGNGQISEALELQSTNLLASVWNVTLFSTVSHSSTNLDYYLAAFPAASTFTLYKVPVSDNTIYYAKLSGDYYARLHVHVQPGSVFPSRAIEIRVSLQRTSGLTYAAREEPHASCRGTLGMIALPGAR